MHSAGVGGAGETGGGGVVVGFCDVAGAEDGEVLAVGKVEEVGTCGGRRGRGERESVWGLKGNFFLRRKGGKWNYILAKLGSFPGLNMVLPNWEDPDGLRFGWKMVSSFWTNASAPPV